MVFLGSRHATHFGRIFIYLLLPARNSLFCEAPAANQFTCRPPRVEGFVRKQHALVGETVLDTSREGRLAITVVHQGGRWTCWLRRCRGVSSRRQTAFPWFCAQDSETYAHTSTIQARRINGIGDFTER